MQSGNLGPDYLTIPALTKNFSPILLMDPVELRKLVNRDEHKSESSGLLCGIKKERVLARRDCAIRDRPNTRKHFPLISQVGRRRRAALRLDSAERDGDAPTF